MKLTVKALSLLLCICLLIPTGVGYVLAEAPAQKQDGILPTGTPELSYDVTEGESEELLLSSVPEIIGADTAHKLGHVRRLYTAEKDLNTVYFKNADDTVTAYYFNHPVKYIDTDGSVKDITLDIEKKSGGSYGSKNRWARTVFSEKMTDGITLSGEGVSITLLPHAKESVSEITPIKPGTSVMSAEKNTGSAITLSPTAVADESGKKISYVYDAKTSYEYSLTYSGFKEDIVVSEYTGQTTYTFTLKTGGLVLAEDDGGFYLLDEKGTEKGRLGRIIVFTADMQNNTFGSMSAKTLTEGEEYLLTIQLDAEYLRDERTKYPITIDPTIELTYESNSTGIQDIVINDKDELSGTDGEISAGKWGSDNSVSRILMKFPGLNLSDAPSADSIISAKVCIKDLMCQHEYLTLECYPFTGNVWNESNATWTNVGQPSTFTGLLDSHEISYYEGVDLETPHVYEFDITGAVRGWVDGTYDQDKGILFKAAADHEADPTHNYKTFASFQRATNKPYVVGVYEDFIPRVEFTHDDLYFMPPNTINLNDFMIVVPENSTVIFSGYDTDRVSVSTSGIVSPINVGKSEIRASITVNGRTYSDTIMVHVLFTRNAKVYKIENSYTENNLDASYGRIFGEVPVTHWTDDGTLKQLWRVNYIGKGQYTIRPMHNPNMALKASGMNVYVEEPPITDESNLINSAYAWRIASYGYDGGMSIESVLYENSISSSFLIPSIIEENYSTLLSFDYSGEEFAWNFTFVSYTSRILVYDTATEQIIHDTAVDGENMAEQTILDGESLSINDYNWKIVCSLCFNISTPLIWTVVNGEDQVGIDSLSGTIYGYNPGQATIEGYISYSGTTISIKYIANVILNGAYYVKNKETGKYLDVFSGSLWFGRNAVQNIYSGSVSQIWFFEYNYTTKYYSIYACDNLQRYYLGVQDNSTYSDTPILLKQYNSSETGIRWRIEYSGNGALKIIPQTGEWNNCVLAVNYINGPNSDFVKQMHYIFNSDYKDEWIVEKIGCPKTVLCGVSNIGHDHLSVLNEIQEDLIENDYCRVMVYSGEIPYSQCYNFLKTADVFTSRSHGQLVYNSNDYTIVSVGIVLNDKEGSELVGLYSHSWNGMSDGSGSIENQTGFTNLEVVLFVGCSTAYGGENGRNLPQIIVENGAKSAIGFKESIDCVEANIWTRIFYEELLKGKTLYEAKTIACNSTSLESGLRSAEIFGDSTITIFENSR